MWYTGHDGTSYRILYSESPDCTSWSLPILVMDKNTVPSLNPTGSHVPFVIKDENIYKMWFSGFSGTFWRLLYTESNDGKIWSTPILFLEPKTFFNIYWFC